MNPGGRRMEASLARWPLREPFAIARHVFEDSLALTVTLHQDGCSGRGECEPHEHDQIAGFEHPRDRAASRGHRGKIRAARLGERGRHADRNCVTRFEHAVVGGRGQQAAGRGDERSR